MKNAKGIMCLEKNIEESLADENKIIFLDKPCISLLIVGRIITNTLSEMRDVECFEQRTHTICFMFLKGFCCYFVDDKLREQAEG